LTGQQETPAEPICLLLLFDVAGQEGQSADTLRLPHIVVQDDVRQLVSYVAADSPIGMKWVVHDHPATSGSTQRRGRECVGLDILKLFQARPIYQLVRRHDFYRQLASDSF